LRFGGSRTYVLDHAPSIDLSSMTLAVRSAAASSSTRTMEFQLYFDGQETTKSAYAVFLLNKVGLLAISEFIAK
jgi:UV radiation resistance-associated gene protein